MFPNHDKIIHREVGLAVPATVPNLLNTLGLKVSLYFGYSGEINFFPPSTFTEMNSLGTLWSFGLKYTVETCYQPYTVRSSVRRTNKTKQNWFPILSSDS